MMVRLSFLLLGILDAAYSQLRICEADGSCRQCADNRYSYYRCRMQDDCFIGEICDNGFCCPNTPPTFSLQREPSLNPLKDDPCPDGSKWERRCKNDEDCTHREELCVEGKCCKNCAMRRRALLDELRTVEIIGQAIPQCDDDGLTYRKRQCLVGMDVCWCVTRFGRRLSRKEYWLQSGCETVRRKQENLALKAVALLQNEKMDSCTKIGGECPVHLKTSTEALQRCECDTDCPKNKKCCKANNNTHVCLPIVAQTNPTTNLTPSVSLVCGANEQYSACYSACQPSCQDPSTPSCPTPNCQPGCVCMPGYIRRDGSPRSACIPRSLCQAFDLTIRCADDRRQYQTCGSACPISCSSRNQPRCESARCVSGCYCRIPYILADAADPLHSQCILPADCPPDDAIVSPMVNEFMARNPQLVGRIANYPTTPTPTLIPNPHAASHCVDPLKNYLSCGSACPASCDRPLSQAASLDCALSCVAGCICRLPYVLVDSKNPNSSCILPQLCPRKSIAPSPATTPTTDTPTLDTCSDPRKVSHNCTSPQCAPSCANPLGRCSSSAACTAGCVCRAPYVLLHPRDPNSRCVLPAECERGCEDHNKEFLACGSSCPMGCDNRRPKSCAPCQTGCFCKNGMVFERSSTWHTSKCVKLDDCPAEEMTTQTIQNTTTTSLPFLELPPNRTMESSDSCPPTTFDVGGRGCTTDMDCPIEQRCCRPLIASLGVSPQRCVCPDRNAVWSACGTICPEYCGQRAVPRCSNTCQAGCHCAPGFVRARNDIGAPCVPRESCEPRIAASNDEVWLATIREISSSENHDDINLGETIAIAILADRNGNPIGRFTFSQINSTSLKIHGEVFGLAVGRHAIVIHQFGDPSEGCSRVGGPFSRSSSHSPSVGDISEAGNFDRIVDWPVYEVVGRAIVIYRFSTNEWVQTTHNGETPLACGTIGIAKT